MSGAQARTAASNAALRFRSLAKAEWEHASLGVRPVTEPPSLRGPGSIRPARLARASAACFTPSHLITEQHIIEHKRSYCIIADFQADETDTPHFAKIMALCGMI